MSNRGIDSYIKQAQAERKTLLSREEEKELAQRIEKGDTEAKKEFIRANLRLVVSVAKHYYYSGRDFDDLVQDGNVGLMKAVDRFDWRRGNKFSTYATSWIKQSISRESAGDNCLIRVPVHGWNNIAKIRRLRAEYQVKDILPTMEELAEKLHLSLENIKLLDKASRPVFSLDQPVFGDDRGKTFLDFYAGQDETRDGMRIKEKEQREALEKAMDELLDEREKQIFRLRVRLTKGSKTLDMRKVGEMFGISGARVGQIQKRSIEKLSAYFREKGNLSPKLNL